jgi:hypothetical protein
VGEQPAADDRLRGPGATLAASGCGQVSKPGETLEVVGKRGTAGAFGEFQLLKSKGFAAVDKASTNERLAALAIARHMIARHRGQLQRLAS